MKPNDPAAPDVVAVQLTAASEALRAARRSAQQWGARPAGLAGDLMVSEWQTRQLLDQVRSRLPRSPIPPADR